MMLPRLRRIVTLARNALRDIGATQVRASIALGLVVTTVSMLTFVGPLVAFVTKDGVWKVVLPWIASQQIQAFVLVVAIAAADRAVDEGASRRIAYGTAAVLGCLAGVVVSEPLYMAWRILVAPEPAGEVAPWREGTAALIYYPIFHTTYWLLVGGSVVFLYADRRAARKTGALLRAAELDRIQRSKRALEWRLQAMQARVEPQFLFDTIAQVERLYETDAAVAGRVLDDLIAYLRAAMPKMRDASSSVGQEIELARAYLDIVSVAGRRFVFHLDVPPECVAVRLPAMTLLPLVNHVFVNGAPPANVERKLGITVSTAEDLIAVAITDSAPASGLRVDTTVVEEIRRRLAALYGERARLEIGSRGGGVNVALTLPSEPASLEGVQA